MLINIILFLLILSIAVVESKIHFIIQRFHIVYQREGGQDAGELDREYHILFAGLWGMLWSLLLVLDLKFWPIIVLMAVARNSIFAWALNGLKIRFFQKDLPFFHLSENGMDGMAKSILSFVFGKKSNPAFIYFIINLSLLIVASIIFFKFLEI